MVGVAAVAALFLSIAWTTFAADVMPRGGHLGSLSGAGELALATVAMITLYALARVLVFEPATERAKELPR